MNYLKIQSICNFLRVREQECQGWKNFAFWDFFGIMHSFNKNWVYVRSECTLTTIHRGYKISFYVMTKYSKIRLCTVDTISNFRCLLKCKSTFLLF